MSNEFLPSPGHNAVQPIFQIIIAGKCWISIVCYLINLIFVIWRFMFSTVQFVCIIHQDYLCLISWFHFVSNTFKARSLTGWLFERERNRFGWGWKKTPMKDTFILHTVQNMRLQKKNWIMVYSLPSYNASDMDRPWPSNYLDWIKFDFTVPYEGNSFPAHFS